MTGLVHRTIFNYIKYANLHIICCMTKTVPLQGPTHAASDISHLKSGANDWPLNPYHSHFIFVDDENARAGDETEFHAELVRQLTNHDGYTAGNGI